MRLFDQARSAEQQGNRAGQDRWAAFAPHRARMTAAIAAVTRAGGRVCLLGVGNGNDVDLAALGAIASALHLVDIDDAAVARAVARTVAGTVDDGQDPALRAPITTHAPIDLTGLYAQLDSAGGRTTAPETLIGPGTAQVLQQLPSGFDTVVSCCVLSQMSWAIKRLAGGGDPGRRAALEQALLAIHLRTLLGLCAPGGTALLMTDLISSEAYPLDELDPDADLTAIMDQLTQTRTAYAVSNPALIRQLIRRDPILVHTVGETTRGQPWLWRGPGERTYLVYPFVIRPKAA